MKKPILLLFAAFYLSGGKSFAQNMAYVVTLNNDTIKCKTVKKVFFGGDIKYQPNNGGATIKAGSEAIKEYQLTKDSSIHVLQILKVGAKPQFVERLEYGKICLYAEYVSTYNGTTTTTTTNWYLGKNNDSLILLKTSALFVFGASRDDRKTILKNMLADNPPVAAAFNSDNSFSFDTIRKYIRQYNQAEITGK